MKKYKFLFKPLFFICSLIFASWMVLFIEKVSPSDFGKYESLFKTKRDTPIVEDSLFLKSENHSNQNKYKKECLKKICLDYKAGVIDSAKLNSELEDFLKTYD